MLRLLLRKKLLLKNNTAVKQIISIITVESRLPLGNRDFSCLSVFIGSFYGTSENAVKTQIYAAIIAYCLVVIVKEIIV